METQTQRAIELYRRGQTKKALSIFKNFKIGFTREEKGVIKIAYECLSGSEDFYKQLGIDTEDKVKECKIIIQTKYGL